MSDSGSTLKKVFGCLWATAVLLGVVGFFGFLIFHRPYLGLYPFGKTKTVTAKVDRVYVDYSGGKDSSSSHYMVGTDQGVFEVSNSLWLWIWNADETYSKIEQGKTYEFQIKGRKLLNMFFQDYPGVIGVTRRPEADILETPQIGGRE